MRPDGWRRALLFASLAILITASCARAPGDAVDGATAGGAPRIDGRYANLYPFALPSLGDLADWYWTWWRSGGPKPPPGGFEAIPVDRPDLEYLRSNRSDTTVTWVGHATVMLQMGGVNIMTDPQFSQRASPFSFLGPERKVRVPFTIGEAPRIEVVLISHNHYDHLDGDSVDALARQPGGPPLFVVPLGLDRWMKRRGIENVIALDWWQSREVVAPVGDRRLRITLVPTQHWSSRTPTDRFETLWGGYVIERMKSAAGVDVDYRFFFAGDTGYAPLFRELIHPRFDHFDFAAIPIGAYEPNRYLHAQHVDPEEAVRIHRDLDVKQSMGIHWGTFVLTSEPFDQPPKDLARALQQAGLPPDRFVVFRHGETRVLEAGRPP
jgi:N-acyl-phosphatidylethanolamine-hydrolysing phospholipase D